MKESIEVQWAEKFSTPESLALLDGGDGDGDENMNAILGVSIEAPTPVDAASRAKCFRKTKTIVDFFGAAAKAKPVTNAASSKRSHQAVGVTAVQQDKPKKPFFDLTENANKRTKAECCICGEQFPEGAKSETINAHIDKCLKDGEPL